MGATRTVVRGLAALAVLAVLTIGLPWLLLRISGSPIPDTIPNWNQIWTALTSRDDGTLLLGLLKYAAWAGWALFAASLAADLVSRARGISVPRLGPQQQLASGLVSAVVAIAVGIPTVGTTAAGAAPPQGPRQTISSTSVVDAPAAPHAVSWRAALAGAAAPPARSAAARTDHQASQFAPYIVRRGDCLWDIAWNELGDPERWPELWQASRHLRQTGGHRITDPDHIEPGWTILIPTTRRTATTAPEPPHGATPSRRSPPPVITPLDPAAAQAADDGRRWPAVTTPLSIHPGESMHEQVGSAQGRALDRWDAAVNRADIAPADRGAWRSRISALHTG